MSVIMFNSMVVDKKELLNRLHCPQVTYIVSHIYNPVFELQNGALQYT